MTKFLHTRLRVADLEKSIVFYEGLGFKCVKRTDRSPAGNELAFLAIDGNEHSIELAYSSSQIPKVPEDLVHTALGFPDLIAACENLEKRGIAIWPENWREKFKESKMAFVTDPDGYEVELLEKIEIPGIDFENENEEDKEKKELEKEKKINLSLSNTIMLLAAALAGAAAGTGLGQYICSANLPPAIIPIANPALSTPAPAPIINTQPAPLPTPRATTSLATTSPATTSPATTSPATTTPASGSATP